MQQHKKSLPMDLDKYIKVYDNALDVNLGILKGVS